MDYKAIEAALSECLSDKDEDVRVSLWRFHDLICVHGPDLLRIVRAMAWVQQHGDDLCRAAFDNGWWVNIKDGISTDLYPTPLDAIEAAMSAMADQQTKGATDEA